jgi:hypothetical protein
MGEMRRRDVFTLAGAATATFKQVNGKEIKSGTVNSMAFKSANMAGNLIMVYLAWTNTSSVSVTDTRGNVYTSVESPTTWGPTSNRSSQVFYAKNIAGGSNTVRATFATAISSPGWADMYIHEYSGIDKVDPLDVSHVNTGMTAAMNSGSVITTNANDIIFGAGASSGIVNQVGTGFTSRSTSFGNWTEDKNVTAVGPYDATASQDGNRDAWVMHMVAFKVDANAPDITPPSTPTGLAQTPTSTSQIDLKWNASTDDVGVAGYRVFRDGAQSGTSATPSYSDNSLAPLTTYGATVSGTIDVTATAADNVGVVGVQFMLDGSPLGAEVTASPYSVSWDTSTAANGAHVLTARVRDAANNSTTSTPVNVTVDRSALILAITSPTNNALVAGIVDVTANASDNVGVAGVQFLVDGVDHDEVRSAPYVLAWDSRTVSNGTHTLTARARDAVGKPTLSPPITVNVANDT